MVLRKLQQKRKIRRKRQIRNKVFGSPERLRLTVSRSLNHIYAQIIDDVKKETLVSSSTMDKEVRDLIKPEMKKVDKSRLVGTNLAKRALDKEIKTVAFDRNGYLYHGRIKALADAARKAGLDF